MRAKRLIARALATTEGPGDALVFEHRIVVRGRRATPSAHEEVVMPLLTPTAEITLGPFFPPSYVDHGANDLTQCQGRNARGEISSVGKGHAA